MPGTATPSIDQQRIVLAVFLAVFLGCVYWQRASDRSDDPVETFLLVHEPHAFDDLDFADAEASWSALQIDARGNLQIDARTETALLDAIGITQREDAARAAARMALLLEKQFGATASRQIVALLPALRQYKESEQRWWTENGRKMPPPHAELFRLQDEILGESLARELFAEQRRLMTLMLSNRQTTSIPEERGP